MTIVSKYWNRVGLSAAITNTETGAPTWLGSVPALRDPADTLLRVISFPKFFVTVDGTNPPPNDNWIVGTSVVFAGWYSSAHDETPISPIDPDPRIVFTTTLTPKYILGTFNAKSYQVLWDGAGLPVDVAGRRTDHTPGTDLPELNIGYQVADPTGTLFNFTHHLLRISPIAFTSALWGSHIPAP